MFFYLIGTIPFIISLKRYGRRTILLSSLLLIDISLFLMGICVIYKQNILLITFMCFFLVSVQGVCSVAWLFINEVTNNKGVSIATTLNYTCLFLVGFIAKPLFEHKSLGDYSFILFGALNTIMTVIGFACMKETKGLSEEELKRLYAKLGAVMPNLAMKEIEFKELQNE